jgi:methionine aminopeptidase
VQPNLSQYSRVQKIAKRILCDAQTYLTVGKTELEIKNSIYGLISDSGITEFWYHNTPVIVSVGANTSVSLSGKEYTATNLSIKKNDFVTIDLSLAIDSHWSILAKSFSIEEGKVISHHFLNKDLWLLQKASNVLHNYIVQSVEPGMTFHEIYHELNKKTEELGVEHLDFKNNFGHSIEKSLDERIYITDGVYKKITPDTLFSIEPHLKLKNGLYGFKEADIYYFNRKKNLSVERLTC